MPDRTPFAHPRSLPVNAEGLSRRQFLALNSALLLSSALPGCSSPAMPGDERRFFRWLRGEDMLSLGFELRNLRIEHRYRSNARLLRIDSAREAFLVVHFAAQHVAERAFGSDAEEPGELPVAGALAGPSRLVFRLPDGLQELALSAESLLAWDRLELELPTDGDAADPGRRDAVSRIEIPYGLSLVPQSPVRWQHGSAPVTHGGRTEVWHTRLLTDDVQTLTVQVASHESPPSFELTPDTDLRKYLPGRRVEARRLLLSPLGGWLDLRGEWKDDTDLARWEHRASAGRDQHVLTVGGVGHLYPFGHAARLMTVTERRVQSTRAPGGAERRTARLRKSVFLLVEEPTRRYAPGAMAFRSLTITAETTPALRERMPEATQGAGPRPMWIEAEDGRPFRFPMTGIDWDGAPCAFSAPAVFIPGNASSGTLSPADRLLAEAEDLYTRAAYDDHRDCDLRGQSVVIAPYRAPQGSLSPDYGDGRSAGDTLLRLLQARFAARHSEDGQAFACFTEAIEARLPSLEAFLDDDRNRGWFTLENPDAEGNKGEVFALALDAAAENRIPMFFDEQADRAGGVAAPSFRVGGISRRFGPVGDGDGVKRGGTDPSKAFDTDRSSLFGSFPLARLLGVDSGDEKSPAIPTIYFKHKKLEDKKKPEEKEPPDDPTDEPTDSEDDKARSKSAKESAGRAITAGLKWTIPLAYGDSEYRLIQFRGSKNGKKETRGKLVLDVSTTKVFGRKRAGQGEDDGNDPDAGNTPRRDRSGPDPDRELAFAAEGKISSFALIMNLAGDRDDPHRTGIVIVFDHIQVKLGPPKRDADDGDEDPEDKDRDPGDKDEKKPPFSAEFNFRIERLEATGLLRFLVLVLDKLGHLPALPQIPQQEPSADYPARLRAPGPADLPVPIGPFDIPDFNWLGFNVRNLRLGGSVGLNFQPRPSPDGGEARVPDHVFSFRIASADKPMLLVATPWGGLAHLGMNFTPRALTDFQFGLGVVYSAELDLVVTKARCEGSLAAMFTFWLEGSRVNTQTDFVLTLSGQARLWYVEIHMLLVAVGSYQAQRELWAFSATMTVRVRIAFFSVKASIAFYYEVAGEDRKRLADDPAAAQAQSVEDLTRDDWQRYRNAFAGLA